MNLEFRIMKILILAFFILYSTFFIPKVYAEGISLGVYPPILQIDATPPANVQAPITIENQGELQIDLKIEVRPFKASDQEDGQIKYLNQSEVNLEDPLIFQKVKIFDGINEITTLSLLPKQKKDLTLRIDLPKDEARSDYYFSIIFLSIANQNLTLNSSQNVSGIASNVLLSIGPKDKASGDILEYSSPILVEKGPVPFTLRVKNTSNHFITPKGNILVENIFGQTIGKVDLSETNILSNTVRNIPSPKGDQMAAYWPEKFVLGIYKAKLTMALSDEGPIFKRDVIFFAFPFKRAAEIILVILIFAYIGTRIQRKI